QGGLQFVDEAVEKITLARRDSTQGLNLAPAEETELVVAARLDIGNIDEVAVGFADLRRIVGFFVECRGEDANVTRFHAIGDTAEAAAEIGFLHVSDTALQQLVELAKRA